MENILRNDMTEPINIQKITFIILISHKEGRRTKATINVSRTATLKNTTSSLAKMKKKTIAFKI